MIWDKFLYGSLRVEASDDAEGSGDDGAAGDENAEEGSEEGTEEGAESEDDEEDEGETDETAAETKEALALYGLLKDSSKRGDVIRILAAQAGFNITDGAPTRKEEAAAKKEIKSILKEQLGDHYYGLIGDKIGTALEQIFEQERGEMQETTRSLESKQLNQEVTGVLNKLAGETKNQSRKFERRMEELALEIHPAAGTSTEKYVRRLYAIASSEHVGKTTANRIADRINSNARNAADRIGTGPGARTQDTKPVAPKGLKSIVDHVYNNLQKSGKR